MSKYRKNSGAVFNLKYHLIWCPKHRRKVLTGKIAAGLEEILQDAARDNEFTIHALEIMPDHIHLFPECNPAWAPAGIAFAFKGRSSRLLRRELKELTTRLPTLWSRSYYCGTAGHVSEKTVKNYIAAQKGKQMRTCKYRIYPDKTAGKMPDGIFHGHRCLYNKALEQRINAWKVYGLSLKAFGQCKSLNQVRKVKYPKVNCTSFQQTMRKLDIAFQAFFRRVKAGEKPGFPGFRPASGFNSIVFRPDDGARIKNGKLILAKTPPVRIKWHRELPEDAAIKQVRILRKNHKWFICPAADAGFTAGRQSAGSVAGIDPGTNHPAAASDGKFHDSPTFCINAQKEPRVLQRSVSGKKKGSNSGRKAVGALAGFHEHIKNQGAGFLHKPAFNLVNKHDAVVPEDLAPAFMNRNKDLAGSSPDAAVGNFAQMLEYKAESAGVRVVKADPGHTSRVCSGYGQTVRKSPAARTHRCNCGLTLDRDVNAAINILHRGASLLGDLMCLAAERVSPQAVCFS